MLQVKRALLIFTVWCILTILIFLQFYNLPSELEELDWEFVIVNKTANNYFFYPSPWRLSNIYMSYLVNNDICLSSEVFIVVIITSYCGNTELRQKIRDVFPKSELETLKIKRVFLLGKVRLSNSVVKYPRVNTSQLKEESEFYGDLLIGDFLEDYRNLTYKHLMGLEWASRYCSQATYILKQDDDILVDYYHVIHLLRDSDLGSRIYSGFHSIYGKLLQDLPVQRNKTSKWYVSKNELEGERYPQLVSGWAYITTIQVANTLLRESRQSRFFWIDDAFVTGILRNKTNVGITDASKMFTTEKEYLECCFHENSIRGLQTTKNVSFWCDFIIGPHEGDFDFMKRFMEFSRSCFNRISGINFCKTRPEDRNLNKTCVTVKNTREYLNIVSGVGVVHSVSVL